MIYIELFYRFFLIGLFSIGGGNATIPYLYELSETTSWFSSLEVTNFIAISEITPGAIGVNLSTYAGFLTLDGNLFFSILGGVVATLGLVSPSVIIIMLVSLFLKKFKNSKLVEYCLYGLRVGSVALITYALFIIVNGLGLVDLSKNGFDIFNFKGLIVALILGVLIFKVKAHPIIFIVIAAIIGILFKL